MQMDDRLAIFLDRCEEAAVRLKISRTTLSTKLFADGKRLNQLASGTSDVGIGRLAKAERQLAELAEPNSADPRAPLSAA